jgi:hypothetical protein
MLAAGKGIAASVGRAGVAIIRTRNRCEYASRRRVATVRRAAAEVIAEQDNINHAPAGLRIANIDSVTPVPVLALYRRVAAFAGIAVAHVVCTEISVAAQAIVRHVHANIVELIATVVHADAAVYGRRTGADRGAALRRASLRGAEKPVIAASVIGVVYAAEGRIAAVNGAVHAVVDPAIAVTQVGGDCIGRQGQTCV